jgi:ribosomal protein S18 acetylase RimI-like enzyme
MGEISLRDYRTADLEAMFRLDEACFAPEFRFDRASMRAFAEERDAVAIVAQEDGGELAGFLIVHVEEAAVGSQGYVVTLDVAVAVRRRRVAARLMEEAERRVATAGAQWIELHVFVENVGAVRFYERMGYERVGELRGFYGRAGLDAFLYRKVLVDV